MVALIIALGLWGTIPVVPALGLALLWQAPLIAAPMLAVAAVKVILVQRTQSFSDHLAGWLRTAAAELRAGMSLRSSLVSATSAYPELSLEQVARLAAAGRPMTEVGEAMAHRPGMEAAAIVLEVTNLTGGSVAPVLEALAAEAADEAGLVAERRSLTVAARWSIGMVGGFPLVVLAVQIARGEIGHMLSNGPVSAALVIAGVVLLVAGVLTALQLMRRARS
jgi:Flp pilus assembly protein TadB